MGLDAKLDASTVRIVLDGVDRDLVCTVDATMIMSRAYGGMMNLYERIKALDIEAFAVAIRAGLMIDGPEAEKLIETIFKTGLIDLRPGVSEFVLLTASGGIRRDEVDDDGGEPDSPGKH